MKREYTKLGGAMTSIWCVRVSNPSEKPRHPERSEGSPESGPVRCLEDPSLRSG